MAVSVNINAQFGHQSPAMLKHTMKMDEINCVITNRIALWYPQKIAQQNEQLGIDCTVGVRVMIEISGLR